MAPREQYEAETGLFWFTEAIVGAHRERLATKLYSEWLEAKIKRIEHPVKKWAEAVQIADEMGQEQ